MRVLARLTRADERASLASPRAHVTSARLRPSSSSSSIQSNPILLGARGAAQPFRSRHLTHASRLSLFRRCRCRSRGVSLGFIQPRGHDSSNSPSIRSSPPAPRPVPVSVGPRIRAASTFVHVVSCSFIRPPRFLVDGRRETRGRTVETWRRPAAAARRRWRTG